MAQIRNLVVVSDTHCGCQLGLCPPGRLVKLEGGGWYVRSTPQAQMWKLWSYIWDTWVPAVVKREPWDLVHNGDAVDGTHHGSTTQITQNVDDQITIAEAVLGPVIERCLKSGGKYYQVKGTEAHVGKSGALENRMARHLGAVPDESGQYARWDLWKEVGKSLVHLLHHIGTTGSAAHEASAINAEFTAELVEAARWHGRAPDFVVRSHRHRFMAVDMDTANGLGSSIVTPGWQLKTPFTWKVAGGRLAVPQFGAIVIRHGDEEAHYRRMVWGAERSITVT